MKISSLIQQTRANTRLLLAKTPNTWRLVVMENGFSEDGRFFFPDEMLHASAPVFEKKPVNIYEFSGEHFNHLPKQVSSALPKGVAHNVVGWIDQVRFEDLTGYGLTGKGLTADFHVTDDKLAASMKSAWDQGRPDLYGFSVDAEAPRTPGIVGGRKTQVVTAITAAVGLDIVSETNAGGQLLRFVASFNRKEHTMNIWERAIKALLAKFSKKEVAEAVKTTPALAGVDSVDKLKEKDDGAIVEVMTKHLSGLAVEAHPEATAEKVQIPANVLSQISDMAKAGDAIAAVGDTLKGDSLIVAEADAPADDKPADDAPADDKPADDKPADAPADAPADKPADAPADKPADAPADKGDAKQVKALQASVATLQRENSERMVRDKLQQSKLPPAAQTAVSAQLSGRTVTEKEADKVIRAQKLMLSTMHDDGDIELLTSGIEVGRDENTKLTLALDKTLGGEAAGQDYSGIEKFTGLKDAYITMTGDKEISGVAKNGNQLQMAALADFPLALANTLHRRITKAYEYHYNVWRSLVNIVPYTDFRENQAIRIGAFADLDTVLDDGEYTFFAANPSEEKIAWTGYTKGNRFYVTRKMIINDDTRLVMRLSEQMGHAAGRTVAKGVFDLILSYTAAINDRNIYDGKVLYHADHGANFDDYALNSDNLTLAKARMMKQQDLDSSEELGIMPANLIVPADLLDTANKLVGSDRTKGDTDDVDKNVHAGAFNVVYSPYLRGDVNNWYLTADPNVVDMIDIGFFNGQDTPELLVQDRPDVGTVFSHDRITYKVRIEPGGAIIDYRGFFASLKS